MSKVATAFGIPLDEINALGTSVGKMDPKLHEQYEQCVVDWLKDNAPVTYKGSANAALGKPDKDIDHARIQDVRKICMLLLLMCSDAKFKFNAAINEVNRIQEVLTPEQGAKLYPRAAAPASESEAQQPTKEFPKLILPGAPANE